MKKLYLKMVLIVFCGLSVFAHSGELEELGFLLFAPNSSDRFMNETQARFQLDNMARYLKERDLVPGQIHIHGYAAAAKNDIEPLDLSRARALFVINELQKRGILKDFFAAPVAYGEVDLWGSNKTEEERNPNRRVIILLDDYPAAAAFISGGGAAENVMAANKSRPLFPWILIILLLLLLGIALIAAHFILASKRKNKSAAKAVKKRAKDNTSASDTAELESLIVDIEPAYEILDEINGRADEELQKAASASAVINGAAISTGGNIKKGKFTNLENAIREIILYIPLGAFFDVHTIVEILLQQHDEVYLTNVGNYTTAAQYHSRISFIIAHYADLVEKEGDSYSKNIHDKFSECHLFRRKL